MTPSEELSARYAQIEREADSFGRLIGVHRIRLSQHVKLEELGEGLGSRAQAVLAAMVCEIDQVVITFPKSRGELDAIMDRLDIEGLDAANKAWKRLAGIVDGETPVDDVEAAKK